MPVQPKITNKIDPSISLANDGGSKSNTGYFTASEGEIVDKLSLRNSTYAKKLELNDNKFDLIKIIIKCLDKLIEYMIKSRNYLQKLTS